MKTFGICGATAIRFTLCISFMFLASCRLVMESDETGYILSDSGDLDCVQPTCSWAITEEVSDNLTAMPAEGYRFVRWAGICSRFPTDRCELVLAPTPPDYMEYDGDVPLWAVFEPETTERDWFRDQDEDNYGDALTSFRSAKQPRGFVVNKRDCDDNNPDAFPGNPEHRDEIDNNCNGKIDEGFDTTIWYRDHDGDGFGNPKVSRVSDRKPLDHVADNTDCNDNDNYIHPEASELRDDIDNDCNGLIDEVAKIYYPDFDGDGWGRKEGNIAAYEQPEDYVKNHRDCDDENRRVNPQATEILDGIDNDCDDRIDEGFIDKKWFKDQDNDGLGDREDRLVGLEQPEGYVDNSEDNCPDDYNPRQRDVDDDGIGDVCDDFTDSDEDEIEDAVDNCPEEWNPEQEDSDEDGRGDKCDEVNDLDWDEDEVPNEEDNCPEKFNPEQEDSDEDGIGDACDDE